VPSNHLIAHRSHEAVATKVKQPAEQLSTILQKYQDSEEFRRPHDSTKRSYVSVIKRIEKKFSDFPLASLTDRRTRGIFMEWRDKIAEQSVRRQAGDAWTVLARILSWADNRGLVLANPCAKGGRLYRGSRIDKIWADDDEAVFLVRAPAHLHLPLMLAIACAGAGIVWLTFHDLRGTAVTRLRWLAAPISRSRP
jgi:integrase